MLNFPKKYEQATELSAISSSKNILRTLDFGPVFVPPFMFLELFAQKVWNSIFDEIKPTTSGQTSRNHVFSLQRSRKLE
jgi:hypothetical protein